MKIFLLFIVIILSTRVIYRITQLSHNKITSKFHILTIDDSYGLKGIMILFVISCHLGIALSSKIPLSGYLASIGTPAVSMFLFLSGYGLLKSYKQKGRIYLEAFFTTRFVKILIPFLIVSIASFLIDYYFGNFSMTYYYKGIMSGFPPMPNSWYIYALLLLYLIYYLSFRFCKESRTSIFVVFILTLVLSLLFKYLGWAGFWYSSLFCFPLGLLFGHLEVPIVATISKFHQVVFPPFLFVALVLLFLFCKKDIPENIDSLVGFISMLFIPISIAIVAMSTSTKGLKLFKFIGTLSYSLYLVHGLIIEMLTPLNLGCAFYIPTLIVLSAISAYVLEIVSGRLLKTLILSSVK